MVCWPNPEIKNGNYIDNWLFAFDNWCFHANPAFATFWIEYDIESITI